MFDSDDAGLLRSEWSHMVSASSAGMLTQETEQHTVPILSVSTDLDKGALSRRQVSMW